MKIKNAVSTIALLGIMLQSLSVSVSAADSRANQRLNQPLAARSASRPRNGGFIPPSTEGAPERTHSGASRRPEIPGRCGGLALTPEGGWGLTTSDQLALYVYFSENTVVDQAILSLKSPDESEYYQTDVELPVEKFSKAGGVIEVGFSDITPKLTTNENYEWSLVLKCNGQTRPDSPILGGSIKRIDSTVSTDSDVSLSEKAQAYGDAGLWYDVLGTLAMMRTEDPSRLQVAEHWSTVLETVGLDIIADAPLVTR